MNHERPVLTTTSSHVAGPNTVVSHVLRRSRNFARPASAERYWTPERIASAKPFDLVADDPEVDEGSDLDRRLRGFLRGMAAREKSEESRSADGAPIAALAPAEAAFDTARVLNRSKLPYTAIGKLLANVNGVDRCGTAWVVGPRAVVTAGHCVFPDSHMNWASKVAFTPQFHRGPVAGTWSATSLHTLAGWIGQGPGARAFDMGGVILDRPIEPVTGVIGWLANANPAQGPFHSVGYPEDWVSSRYNFDGQEMWRCIGAQLKSSSIIKMANNMTKGSSGGPWLIARNGRIYANGLNSFRSSNEPETLASPYFGPGFVNLISVLNGTNLIS